jgi:hypothetical protein
LRRNRKTQFNLIFGRRRSRRRRRRIIIRRIGRSSTI